MFSLLVRVSDAHNNIELVTKFTINMSVRLLRCTMSVTAVHIHTYVVSVVSM